LISGLNPFLHSGIMYILITGAAGFIGQLVAKALLDDSAYTVLLTDIVEPPIPEGAKYPENAKTLKADLQADAGKVVDKSMDAAFVFHGIMSAGSEANFDLGMSVNVDATRSLLEAIRNIRPGMRVIYASSQAVYGEPLPQLVTEKVVPTPQGSYGAEKMICEILINEYNRRGFIDGFSLRFPTVSVRPGKPTAAASSFISGIIREPMNGQEAIVPLKDHNFPSWVCSPKTLCRNLLHALKLPSDKLPPHIRTVNAPGILVTIQDMLDALEKVGGKDKLQFVKEETDPALERILRSWAWNFDNSLAYSLGYQADTSFEDAVRDYKESLR
jgi:nucleoside-diphosphate-sugar epimerase